MSAKVRQHIPSSAASNTPRTGFKTPRNLALMSPRVFESPYQDISRELMSNISVHTQNGHPNSNSASVNRSRQPGPAECTNTAKLITIHEWNISKLDCMLYSAMFVHIHPKKQVCVELLVHVTLITSLLILCRWM